MGDALGLACENLTRATIARRFAPIERYRLFGRTGFISDDTEQTAMVAESLLRAGPDPSRVARAFAWKLRLWLLLLPAGIGFATVRACLKLLLGVPARWSGVRSAGNGAAMRAVPIGLFAANPDERRALVDAVSRVTHTHENAIEGAALVAEAAARLAAAPPDEHPTAGFVSSLSAACGASGALKDALAKATELLSRDVTPEEASRAIGTTGWVVHTVPFALFCLVRGRTFIECVGLAVEAGGDTDTIAAIAGGLAGARFGAAAIPSPLLEALEQRGRGRRHLDALAAALASRTAAPRPGLAYRLVRAPAFVVLILVAALLRFLDAPRALALGEWRA